MTDRRNSEVRNLALKVHCPVCSQPPGVWCIGATGQERLSVHQARINKAKDND